jgi:hypothetical protein
MEKEGTKEKALQLLNDIDNELRSSFEKIKSVAASTGRKGSEYEALVGDFLNEYLGGAFQAYQGVRLIDRGLRALTHLSTKENEFDVVAVYQGAVPRVVLELREIVVVPYDAVAFVVEVKQSLDASSIKDGLEKLSRLNELDITPKRFGVNVAGDYVFTERPLRWLFAFERKLSDSALSESLARFGSGTDLVTILRQNEMLVRTSLPVIAKRFVGATKPFILSKEHSALLSSLLHVLVSLPAPIRVGCAAVFVELIKKSGSLGFG